jgi:hypothetical protein
MKFFSIFISVFVWSLAVSAQVGPVEKKSGTDAVSGKSVAESKHALRVIETRLLDDPTAKVIAGHQYCDGEGNLYFKSFSEEGSLGFDIYKIDVSKPSINRLDFMNFGGNGWWRASPSMIPDKDGNLYTFIWFISNDSKDAVTGKKKRPELYLVKYGKNGSVDRKEKVDFRATVSNLAVFGDGSLLIAGRRENNDSVQLPWTAIVSSSGAVKKEITLEDDREIQQKLKDYDPAKTTSAQDAPTKAIDLGFVDSGPDGLVYLMRYAEPYMIYVIDSEGSTVRRLNIEPPAPGYTPKGMHVTDGMLAVLFVPGFPGPPRIMKVFHSVSGDDFAQYEVTDVGGVFGCFTQDLKFTFLSAREKKLTIQIAAP